MAIEVERDYIQKWTEVYLPDHKSKNRNNGLHQFYYKNRYRTLFYGTMMSFCGFSVVFKEFERIFLNVLEGNVNESCRIQDHYSKRNKLNFVQLFGGGSLDVAGSPLLESISKDILSSTDLNNHFIYL